MAIDFTNCFQYFKQKKEVRGILEEEVVREVMDGVESVCNVMSVM